MSSIHPRRNARERTLEALFAQQFSDENPQLVLDRILKSNSNKEKNLKFIQLLFFCVLDNMILVRFGRGLIGNESHVFLPIIIVELSVKALKCFKSSDICHGSLPFFPIPPYLS